MRASGTQGAHPWSSARFVVIGHEPSPLETTVAELEAQGAQPAVMFERTRAIRALQVTKPDVVVLNFGNQSGAPESLLGSFDQVRPLLPSRVDSPVVVLAELGVAERVRQAGVTSGGTSLHVVPHDDQGKIRAALTVALQESSAARVPGAAESMTEPVPASTVSPPLPTTGLWPRRAVLPGIAGLVLAAGGSRLFTAQSDSRQPPGTPSLVSGVSARQSTASPPALMPPPGQPLAAGHMSATPSPTVPAPEPSATAGAAQRGDGSESLPLLGVQVTDTPIPARLPITGSGMP